MNLRVRTGLIFTLVILAFVVPAFRLPWLPLILFAVVGLAAALELHHALARRVEGLSLFTMLAASLFQFWPLLPLLSYRKLSLGWPLLAVSETPVAATWATDYLWLLGLGLGFFAFLVLLAILLLALAKVLRHGVEALPAALAEATSFLWLAFPLSMVTLLLYAVPNGWLWLLLALFSPWISDVAAYYVGVNVGHTRILPRLSPKKTLEGTIGGIIGTMLCAALFFVLAMAGEAPMQPGLGRNIAFGLFAGFVLSLASQCGDWLASAVKRYVKIKDYSHILPGHGGILDRFDGVLFTLPLTLALSLVYFLF